MRDVQGHHDGPPWVSQEFDFLVEYCIPLESCRGLRYRLGGSIGARTNLQHVVVFNQKHRKSTELDPQYDTFMLTTVFFFRFLCFLLPLFPSFNTSMTNTGRVEIDHQLDTFLYYVDNRVFPSLSRFLSKVS